MGNKYIFNNTQETKDKAVTIVTVSDKFNELTSPVSHASPSGAAVESPNESEPNFWQKIFSWRGFIVLLMHSTYVIHGISFSTVSMALVCMCGPVVHPSQNVSSNATSFFSASEHWNESVSGNGLLLQEKKYEFSWDSQTRGFLLSGVFFTSFLAPIFANALRGCLGNKVSLTLLTTVVVGLNILSPVTARANVYVFLALRIVSGCVINSHIPIVGDTLAWWLPVKEKLTSVSFVISGWYVAGSLGPLISGYLCLIPVDNGWPLIFYFNGLVAVPWTIAFVLLSSRKPEEHPFISQKEKDYIIRTRAGLGRDTDNSQAADRTPYRKIISSVPVLSYIAVVVAVFFNINILAACVPAYMASVLQFSLQEVGIIMGVTWAMRFPAAIMWSAFGNWLLRFESLTANWTRKICLFLGQTLAGVFAVGIAFCDKQDKWTASALFVVCMASATMGTSMLGIIPLDMAPRYAGFITSLSTSVAFLISLIGPILVSVVTEKGTFEEWQVVWFTMGLAFFAPGLLFAIFGSARLQPWAAPNIEITAELAEPPKLTISQIETETSKECTNGIKQ